MNGKIIGIVILISAMIAGAGLYYLQVYGFYEAVTKEDVRNFNQAMISNRTASIE